MGEVERIRLRRTLAESTQGCLGHGAVALRVWRQRPGGEENPQALDDPVAGNGDGPLTRGVMAQAREILRPFR